MKKAVLSNPEIQKAIEDLKYILQNTKHKIKKVMLFGSAVGTSLEVPRDIDFFISFSDIPFKKIRNNLISVSIDRRLIVENFESVYTNHPHWPKEKPLPIHIILYRSGISKFSEKLQRAKQEAIDISSKVL